MCRAGQGPPDSDTVNARWLIFQWLPRYIGSANRNSFGITGTFHQTGENMRRAFEEILWCSHAQ